MFKGILFRQSSIARASLFAASRFHPPDKEYYKSAVVATLSPTLRAFVEGSGDESVAQTETGAHGPACVRWPSPSDDRIARCERGAKLPRAISAGPGIKALLWVRW